MSAMCLASEEPTRRCATCLTARLVSEVGGPPQPRTCFADDILNRVSEQERAGGRISRCHDR
jgi:hypothetical protein